MCSVCVVKMDTRLVMSRFPKSAPYIKEERDFEGLPVRTASPESVIWRASRLSDLREVNPDKFFKPLSVTEVNERLRSSNLVNPKTYQLLKSAHYYMYEITIQKHQTVSCKAVTSRKCDRRHTHCSTESRQQHQFLFPYSSNP